jgi:hypothetical protein
MKTCRTILPIAFICLPWLLLQSQNPVGTLAKGDAELRGWIMPAGDWRVLSGSTINARQEPALLHLARGGEVRVCPGGSLSVTASSDGRELTMAIGAGGIEVDYSLLGSADTVLTPDFRVVLASPGKFHFAISSDAGGTACVRALAANQTGLVVTEAMSGGTYHVRSDEQVRFQHGNIMEVEAAGPLDCGCSQPIPRLSAGNPKSTLPPSPAIPNPAQRTAGTPATAPTASLRTTPPPPLAPGDLQITVDAPFVFRAKEISVPPAPFVVRLHFDTLPSLALLAPPQAPAPHAGPPDQLLVPERNPDRDKPKGVLGRLRSFFAGLWALRTT